MRCFHAFYRSAHRRVNDLVTAKDHKRCKKHGHTFHFREGPWKRECIVCGLYQLKTMGGSGWMPDG